MPSSSADKPKLLPNHGDKDSLPFNLLPTEATSGSFRGVLGPCMKKIYNRTIVRMFWYDVIVGTVNRGCRLCCGLLHGSYVVELKHMCGRLEILMSSNACRAWLFTVHASGDQSRTDKTICLWLPSLKRIYGLPGQCPCLSRGSRRSSRGLMRHVSCCPRRSTGGKNRRMMRKRLADNPNLAADDVFIAKPRMSHYLGDECEKSTVFT